MYNFIFHISVPVNWMTFVSNTSCNVFFYPICFPLVSCLKRNNMTGILGNSLRWSAVWCTLAERAREGSLWSPPENKLENWDTFLHPLVWTPNWGAQGREYRYWDGATVPSFLWISHMPHCQTFSWWAFLQSKILSAKTVHWIVWAIPSLRTLLCTVHYTTAEVMQLIKGCRTGCPKNTSHIKKFVKECSVQLHKTKPVTLYSHGAPNWRKSECIQLFTNFYFISGPHDRPTQQGHNGCSFLWNNAAFL